MAEAGIHRESIRGKCDKTGSSPIDDPVHPGKLLVIGTFEIGTYRLSLQGQQGLEDGVGPRTPGSPANPGCGGCLVVGQRGLRTPATHSRDSRLQHISSIDAYIDAYVDHGT